MGSVVDGGQIHQPVGVKVGGGHPKRTAFTFQLLASDEVSIARVLEQYDFVLTQQGNGQVYPPISVEVIQSDAGRPQSYRKRSGALDESAVTTAPVKSQVVAVEAHDGQVEFPVLVEVRRIQV